MLGEGTQLGSRSTRLHRELSRPAGEKSKVPLTLLCQLVLFFCFENSHDTCLEVIMAGTFCSAFLAVYVFPLANLLRSPCFTSEMRLGAGRSALVLNNFTQIGLSAAAALGLPPQPKTGRVSSLGS